VYNITKMNIDQKVRNDIAAMLQRIVNAGGACGPFGRGMRAGARKKRHVMEYEGEGLYAGARRKRAPRRPAGMGMYAGARKRKVKRKPRAPAKRKVGEGVRRRKARAGAMSPWIKHVMAYAAKHRIPYGEAMHKARATYRKC
jgi:hypothetical protein